MSAPLGQFRLRGPLRRAKGTIRRLETDRRWLDRHRQRQRTGQAGSCQGAAGAEGEPMEGSTDPGDGTEANLSNGRNGGLLKERWLLVESSD
jgi:hypothetical protein